MTTTTTRLASLQHNPATPACMYTSTSARCWCGATIMLRTDDYWTHGAVVGLYCPEPREVVVFEAEPAPAPVETADAPAQMVKLPASYGIKRCDWSGCTDLGRWGVTSRDGKGYCGNHGHRVMHQALRTGH